MPDVVDGFSFAGAVQKQAVGGARASEPQAAGAQKVKNIKGGGNQKTKEGTKCKVCDESQVGSSPFCWDHKRAFGIICKDSIKDKTSQKYEDYKAIFGEGRAPPPDPGLADQVVVEFAQARQTAAADGKALPPCNLSSYRHVEGHRASDDAVKGAMIWDKEIFLTRMPQYRPWDKARCLLEWDKLENDPNVLKDVGYKGATTIKIPPELIGNIQAESRQGSFEERSVSTATKATKVSDEVRKAWISQTAAGFHTPGAVGGKSPSEIQAAFSSGLAVGSIGLHTGTEVQLLDGILAKTATEQAQMTDKPRAIAGEEPSSDVPTDDDLSKKRKANADDVGESPSKKKKDEVLRDRNKLFGTWRRNFAKYRPDLEKQLKSAVAALSSATEAETSGLDIEAMNLFRPSVAQKECILCAVLGARVTRRSKDDPQLGEWDYRMIEHPDQDVFAEAGDEQAAYS